MKSTSHFYTQNNKKEGGKCVFSKIDKALCNAHWDNAFPNIEASFFPEGCYDHSSILVLFYPQVSVTKPFKFFNFWANNEMFLEIVLKVQNSSIHGGISFRIQQKLKHLKTVFKDLCLRTLIQVLLCKAKMEFSEIQTQLHNDPSNQDLTDKEILLAYKLKGIRNDYTSLLQQQAKVNQLKYGDENSSVFHNSIQRRTKNRINMLIDNTRTITDPNLIHNTFIAYYSELLCKRMDN